MSSSRPSAYWDRVANTVRDWKTDQPLPEYQGTCLVYLDVQGPVFLRTFLKDGKRCWMSKPPAGAAASTAPAL